MPSRSFLAYQLFLSVIIGQIYSVFHKIFSYLIKLINKPNREIAVLKHEN